MSELGSSQITSLLEALPGIANVLRSPVADAMVHLARAAARLEELRVDDAAELLRYAVRRSLLANDEAERVIAEVQAAFVKRQERAAVLKARPKAKPVRPKAVAKPRRPAPKPVAKSSSKKKARASRR